jgi:hypothetical protein
MDILIQPKSTTRPVPSVRYRHTEKYDGGPFLTYPLRRNKPWMIPNDELGESNFSKHEVLHPTPHEELESFLQIWLYFGLIFEFLFFGNKGPDSADREDTPRDKDIRMMYDLFRSDDRRFIISSEIRAIFPELFKFSWESKEDYLRRCKHLDLCLIRTNFVLDCVGPDFDPSLKFAIAALEDYLGGHISRACVKYQFGSMYFNISSKGTHSSEICGAMEKSGWCPSDIQRIKDKYPSVQTWNLLSQLDRSEPPRDHSGCSKFICTSYQIDTRNYRVGHCLAGCTCSEYLVDNEATIAVLQKPGLVPLLDIRPGLSLAELKIDVIESSSVLYIAISHVRNPASWL